MDAELFGAAQTRLVGREPKVLLTSWSPPAILKENGILSGTGNSVLVKGNDTDLFVYDLLAKFWVVRLKQSRARDTFLDFGARRA